MNKNKEMEEIKKTISDKFYDAMDINSNVSALMGRKICEEVVLQAITQAEDNMRKRCLEALPKKREHTNRCGSLEDVGEVGYCTCGTDDFNSAIDQATQNINNLDKDSE